MSIVMDYVDDDSYFNGTRENNVPEMDEGIKQLIINRNINGLEADGKEYDWWQFLEKINAQIGNATHSEDKKLGYYFCKPDNNQTIDAETFVSKVVFYLWNDVFKDFAEDAGSIFNDEDGSVCRSTSFTPPMPTAMLWLWSKK